MSRNEETLSCSSDNCHNKVEWICIVEDGHNVCSDHLPPAGQGTEYFWPIDGEK